MVKHGTPWQDAAMASRFERLRALLPQESRVLALTLGIVLCLWLFMELASTMTSGRTQSFDERVLLALRLPENPGVPVGPRWCQAMALEVTALGSGIVLFTITLLVAGYLAIERRFGMLAYMLLASIGGMILNTALKAVFARPRPAVVPPLAIVGSTSFPSGHSMIAAVVYLTLGALLARTTTRWRLRLYYVGVALFLSAVIGLSRLYLGVHYPTDVLAGWCAGMAWALGCELGAVYLQRRGVVAQPAER